MASPVTAEHPPIPSPPPAYLRSTPPFPSASPGATPRTIPSHLSPTPFTRKPLAVGTQNSESAARIQASPSSPVRIDRAYKNIPQASSVQVEDFHNVPAPSQLQMPQLANLSINDGPSQSSQQVERRESVQVPQLTSPHSHSHTPGSSGSWSMVDEQVNSVGQGDDKRKVAHENERASPTDSSHGSIESGPQSPEDYQPLAYHHQRQKQQQNPPNVRHSTMGINLGDQNAGSSNNLAVHGTRNAQRQSQYSTTSESGVGQHRRNLSASPYLQPRSTSRNSPASADTRPLSVLDLLHSSYPQPGPSAAHLDHSHLQSSVGNHASLLSHEKTFDMYLANVKKTDVPAVQYEFAVFMINAMREMPNVDLEDSNAITRQRLLRESKTILQRLADRSYPFAQYYLADGYASGLFSKGKEDYERAFPNFLAASKHGHVEACYRTALCYEFGWGVRVDGGRAVQFYRQAASKNHPGAMLRMAKACLNGDMGLGKRYRDGLTWLKRATESSDEQYNSAPYELGLMHEHGDGNDVFKDESYAAQLFTKSAELGHVEAAYRMGDAYEHGKLNCPRDPALSIHFYTTAAQSGHHALAMMALCAWYLVGAEPILEKDENEAYEWATRAAALGLVKAQYAVGYFTEMGIGCRRDPLEANVWYVRAAEQGDERAKQRIAAIRAAADGANPATAARGGGKSRGGGSGHDKTKQKRFVIF
ncbi:hypothetical protein N7539_008292 [Penicillium diatomitis]|uniref:Uncharacterized protein n=1 Tax=Penicillium diatomitis TaxID=2819901 RepID=A0A9X0BN15_9EURO|nr:uncharacterized protein N7539_008292 [Penicillium diatomitis]KAJ5475226.1 hypothetical protein N7539_008292 [Penicillium diatomitis]